LGYLADPNLPLRNTFHDAVLFEGAQFYRMKKEKRTLLVRKRFPEYLLAQNLYNANHPGGFRWYLEALCMTNITEEEIRKALQVDCPIDALRIFRKAYFDILPYINSDVAVTSNVLSTSRQAIDISNDHDYTWKMFAYTWGADSFLELFCNKQPKVPRKYQSWFKDVSQNRLMVSSFHAISDMRYRYNRESFEILNTAQQNWNLPANSLKEGEELAKKDVLGSLLSHIDMCLQNADERPSAVEQRAGYNYAMFSEEPGLMQT
jgi:hypothetical protein